MMTDLPKTLTVDGVEREIYCDFRDVIQILIAYADDSLSLQDKTIILLTNLYVDDFTEFTDIQEALNKAIWFIDWGKENKESSASSPRLIDWETDFNMIISAVDKSVKTVETSLELPFMHWWTFLSKFSERGECLYSTVLSIREKLAKGKKLDKWEKEVLRENRDIIMLKVKGADDFENEMWGE